MKIYPYMKGSKSVRALADALGIKVLKREGKGIGKGTIINWGASVIHRDLGLPNIINEECYVADAADKLKTFKKFAKCDVPTVEWTTDKDIAENWEITVVRHVLNGHSGNGIEIIEGPLDLPDAPLYTKYTKKKDEYRIHVFQGNVIFQQRKARKKDVPDEEVNWQVRNLANGFIFANDEVVAPEVVREAGCMAVAALGLDFGAADIGFKDGSAVVYEVNTAPGLTGKTLDAYVNAFKTLVG